MQRGWILLIALLFTAPVWAQAQAPATKPPIVRSLVFEYFDISVGGILARLQRQGVRLSVERPYSSKEVEHAAAALEDLLAEKGRSGARVEWRVRPIPPQGRAVEVVFTAMKE